MNDSQIIITPVNNGFVVTLPFRYENINDNANNFAEAMAKAAKMMQGDPVLNEIEISENKKDIVKKAENIFIFDTMEKVLAFLAEKFC